MASEKAVEAARREAVQRGLSSAWQDPNDIYHILNAASAIDGDYNAGVEAARAWHLERAAHYSRQIHDVYDKETFHTEAAKSLEKLKRPS